MGRALLRAMPLIILAAVPMTLAVHAACPFGGGKGAPAGAARHIIAEPRQAPFDREAVESLDWEAVKADLRKLLTTSQPEWPADWPESPTGGNYAGLFIRQAWHCAGSYRSWDGRGGCEGGRQRFFPEQSWADNTNLDKSRKLLAPLKDKYGSGLSWGDLIALAGNVAIEITGGPVLGFCAGRVDDADGKASLPLGPTPEQRAIAPCEAGDGNCEQPLGQTTMGLIYVNPEGVMGEPVPENSAPHIRGTFGRMGMNDSETVALIGAHAIGKTHGACPTGPGPDPSESPDNPWPGTCGEGELKGKGPNAFTSGIEVQWTTKPWEWSNEYFQNLLKYDWEKYKGPGGAWQWRPKYKAGSREAKRGQEPPKIGMMTSDVALTKDPEYLKIVQKYAEDREAFDHAFKHAWYKLMTRDQGPITRCLGPDVPPAQPFQHPLPPAPKEADLADFDQVRSDVLEALSKPHPAIAPDATPDDGESYTALFATLAWQCASTFRATDYAGGCNGARIRLSPLKDWPVNKGVSEVLRVLQPIKDKHGKGLSWADLIVLSGTAALEAAAGAAPGDFGFCPARVDSDEADEMDHLAPRTYVNASVAVRDNFAVAGLTPAEGVALFGRPRSAAYMKLQGYSGSWGGSPASLSSEYFRVLLSHAWVESKSASGRPEFHAEGMDDVIMTPDDVAITKDKELAKIAKKYADDEALFRREFAKAWTKVMNADRLDGPASNVCDGRPAPSVAAS